MHAKMTNPTVNLRSVGYAHLSNISIGELFEWTMNPKEGMFEITKRIHSDPDKPENANLKMIDEDNVSIRVKEKWLELAADDFSMKVLQCNVNILRAVRDFGKANQDIKLKCFGITNEDAKKKPDRNMTLMIPMKLAYAEKRNSLKMDQSRPFYLCKFGKDHVIVLIRSIGFEDMSHISLREMIEWANNPGEGPDKFIEKLHLDPCAPDNKSFEFLADLTVRVYVQGSWAIYSLDEFNFRMNNYATKTLKEVLKLQSIIKKAEEELFSL